MTFYTYERYYVAHDALLFLTFIPAVVVFLCSLCLARHRKDPARSAFTYLKIAFALFTLFMFLDFCGYGLALATSRLENDEGVDSYYSDSASIIRHLQYASAETFAVDRLIEAFSDIVVFIMLVSLGTGIIIAQTGSASSLGKVLKLASFGMSAILAILTVAQFALRTHFFAVVYGSKFSSSGYTSTLKSQFNSSRQIDFSFRVLIFVLALGIVAQSIMVKIKTRGEPRVSMASNIFIASAGLWLLRNVYGMAAMASTVNLKDFFHDPAYHNYFDILDIVFGVWPQLILLSLVFGLGSKKANGLWSTEQPFMTTGGNSVSPWGFNYDPNQASQPAMAHQPQVPLHQQSWPQQQPYYPQPGHNGVPPQQQSMPQYAPQQPSYQPYVPPNMTRSPPPHEDAMGFNHQANGTPPQAIPQPYYEKQ